MHGQNHTKFAVSSPIDHFLGHQNSLFLWGLFLANHF